MSGKFVYSLAVIVFLAIPHEVLWSYFVGGVVFAIGIIMIFVRGEWPKARAFEKLILFGPVFYAAPLAAFGTEHFTLTKVIASLIPAWIPWHLFWAYFVGACFIAAAFSLVIGIQARLAASLLALNFFLFVVLMDIPGWLQNPRDRFGLTLALRELAFSGGPLALAASLTERSRERLSHPLAHPRQHCAILRCDSRIVLQLRAIPPRRSRSRCSAGTADPHLPLRTRPLDLPGSRGLCRRGYPPACRQKNPLRRNLGGLGCALRRVGRLCADRCRGTRQPRQGPELSRRYPDVLRRRSSPRLRHARES